MQREELEALAQITESLKRPTHLLASLEQTDPTIRSLVKRNLIHWRPSVRGSGMGNKFRAVPLTKLGQWAITSSPRK